MIGHVAELWQFPVKSMQGSRVESVVVDARGVAGDREWAVVDVAARKVLSAKRWGALLMASARHDGNGDVVITLPNGTEHEAGAAATDDAVSAWLDHEVRVAGPPEGDGLPYEIHVDATDDSSETWEFPGPPGGPFVDLAAAHLLTTASLRAAAALHPDGAWEARRFRPTALIDLEGEWDGFVEDGWVGATVALGDAVTLSPFMATPRCSMPTRAQPGLLRDPDIARSLSAHHDLNLGVYCGVERPGRVAVGDAVRTGGTPGT